MCSRGMPLQSCEQDCHVPHLPMIDVKASLLWIPTPDPYNEGYYDVDRLPSKRI